MPVAARALVVVVLVLWGLLAGPAARAGRWVETPYQPQKVLFEFYFNEPAQIDAALYWLRSFLNPLMAAPYHLAPEENDIIVLLHGTEIVTVAKKNYARYRRAVDRMAYYAELGVRFRVCGLAAEDYDYAVEDFQDFVEVVPSAITEIAHWQQQGYALIVPRILDKRYRIDEIR